MTDQKQPRRAVCPGSFDPVTNGHLDIFHRAAEQFDEVIVLVTGNPDKKSGLFSVPERMELIRQVTTDIPNLSVDNWGGLLVDYTTANDVGVLVKGLRSSLDYGYEQPMAQMNRRLSGVDTFFVMTDEKFGYVSSSLCKEVVKYGGDVTGLVPELVVDAMKEKYRES
jgi:pantetheine-phosphate adenylyltransferase